MFESIYKKRKNPIFNIAGWGLLVLVCMIFMFVGYSPNVDFMGSGNSVAQVNGEAISYSQFSRYLERVQENRGANNKMTPQERSKLNKEVVDSLVNRALIIQSAKDQGVVVGAEEIRDFLKQIPQFQDKGAFSILKYKELIRAQGMTEARFEEQIVEDLIVQKMNNFYMMSSSDNKMIDDQEDAISKIKMNVAFIKKAKTEMVADAEITSEDVNKFVTEKSSQLNEYYKAHANDEFSQKESVKAQHILVKTSPEMSEEKALKKIKEIASQTTVKNFSEMAKKWSEDPGSKDKNGDLGFFERGRMVKEFDDVAFSMESGKISEPFKSSFGYHILLVNQKTQAKTLSFDDAKTSIAKKMLKEEKATDAVKVLKESLAQGQVDSVLAKKGWSWEETGTFGLGDMMVPKIGDNSDVLSAAMSLSMSQPVYKDVIEKDGFYYIVKLKGMGGAEVADKGKSPANNMDIFKQIFQQQKSYEMFQGWMDQLRKTASISVNQKIISQN